MAMVPVYDIVNCGPRHRFSANGKLVHNSGGLNQQNIGRNSKLRKAIHAPGGHVIVAADLSNIELRVNMLMCRERQAVQRLRDGVDLYCVMAEEIYNKPVTPEDKDERQIGKIAELALGYHAGAGAFRNMLWAQAQRDVDAHFAQHVVNTYARAHPNWANTKVAVRNLLKFWASSTGVAVPVNPFNAPVEMLHDGILMPSGFKIKYPNVREVVNADGRKEFVFDRKGKMYPSGTDKLWSGVVCENVSQGLAACVLAAMQKDIALTTGVHPVLQIHDSLMWVLPEAQAQAFAEEVSRVMHISPAFWPELPVKADVGIGYSLGDIHA